MSTAFSDLGPINHICSLIDDTLNINLSPELIDKILKQTEIKHIESKSMVIFFNLYFFNTDKDYVYSIDDIELITYNMVHYCRYNYLNILNTFIFSKNIIENYSGATDNDDVKYLINIIKTRIIEIHSRKKNKYEQFYYLMILMNLSVVLYNINNEIPDDLYYIYKEIQTLSVYIYRNKIITDKIWQIWRFGSKSVMSELKSLMISGFVRQSLFVA